MNDFLAALFMKRRVVLATLAVILVVGMFAYSDINKEMDPDVPVPFFSITMIHDGISPEDSERLLIRPMEVELRSLEGLKQMSGFAREGSAMILLEFEPTIDNNTALLDVREKVSRARPELPDDTLEPIVYEASASDEPVITVVLYSDGSQRALYKIARQLKDGLESLGGVLSAEISGDREDLLEIIVDPVKLISYNVSQSELIQKIRSNHQLVAAGSIETGSGKFSIKVPGLFQGPQDVMNLPIKTSGDGVIRFSDLAEVRRSYKDASSMARFNGMPSVTLEVQKRVSANPMKVALATRDYVNGVIEQWPGAVNVSFVGDTSKYVLNFLASLQNSVMSAIILVAIIVVGALGWRSASLVGIAIPGSFLFGILLLWGFGYSINQVVMFGLILSVGLLVDGAIVISEYADRKLLEGMDRVDAYRSAAQRMAWPIISSTATTLAAFFPLLFWPGIMGRFMIYLPITLIFTLIGSGIMALIFIPALGSLYGKAGGADAHVQASLAIDRKLEVHKLVGFTGFYARFLKRAVRFPVTIFALAIFVLLGSWAAYFSTSPGVLLFPESDGERIDLQVRSRGNLSVADMGEQVKRVEDAIKGLPDIESYYSIAGTGRGGGMRSAADTIGAVSILLKDWKERRRVAEIVDDLRRLTMDIPGIIIEPKIQQGGPPMGKDIQVQVSSLNPELIEPVVTRIRHFMDTEMAGLVDSEDSRPLPGVQWELEVDRLRVGQFGADIATVGYTVQMVTNGIKAAEYRPDDVDDEVDIRVRFPESDRGISALDQLYVQTPKGNIPITNMVKRVAKPAVQELQRVDMARTITIRANVEEGVLPNDKVAELRTWIAGQNFSSSVRIKFVGSDEMQQESAQFIYGAFGTSLFLMAIILLTQFNSFYQTGLILSAVVFSTVGVALGLLITDRPFVVVMTGIGVISLSGIVVNNNIVLIDTYDRFVKMGIEPIEAIIRTGTQRLRPVMLTTATTIIGLMPMALKFNVDFFGRRIEIGSPTSHMWVDLATAIIFGLGVSTLLTLIVTPAMLALRVKVNRRLYDVTHHRPAPKVLTDQQAASRPAE